MSTKVLIWCYISPSSLILIENTQKLKSRVSLRMGSHFAHLSCTAFLLLVRSSLFQSCIPCPFDPEMKLRWRPGEGLVVMFTSYRASWHQEMEGWRWHTEWRKALGSVRDTDATETLALLGVGQGQAGGRASQANFSLFSLHEAFPTPQWELSYTVFSFLLNKHLEKTFCGHCFKQTLYELPKSTSRWKLT